MFGHTVQFSTLLYIGESDAVTDVRSCPEELREEALIPRHRLASADLLRLVHNMFVNPEICDFTRFFWASSKAAP